MAAVLVAVCPTAAVPETDSSRRPPLESYLLHCSGCHGPDGRGVAGTSPSLRELAPLLEIEGGRAYLARVPGVAQAPVSDAALAELLNWILETFSDVVPDPPYRAEEVSALRREPLRDPLAARAELLP